MDFIRSLKAAAIAAIAATVAAPAVAQQNYPNQIIRIVLAVPPGGSVDSLARVVAKYQTGNLGQPVIIDNKPGGSNKVATEFVAKAAPDGYTLYQMGSSQPQVEATALSNGVPSPYDTLRDLTSIGTLATNTYALVVHPSIPARTANEFIAFAKSKPGFITYGSTGVGKSDHVAGALFAQMTGIDLLHVPFKGLGEAVQELVPGRILTAFSALPVMAAHVKAGKLRLIGPVSTDRSFQFPDVPTLAEQVPLPGYAVETWIGIMAPVKTPRPLITRLNGEINKMLKDESFVTTQMHPLGLGAWSKTPEQMTALINDDLKKYTKLFKELGVKFE